MKRWDIRFYFEASLKLWSTKKMREKNLKTVVTRILASYECLMEKAFAFDAVEFYFNRE